MKLNCLSSTPKVLGPNLVGQTALSRARRALKDDEPSFPQKFDDVLLARPGEQMATKCSFEIGNFLDPGFQRLPASFPGVKIEERRDHSSGSDWFFGHLGGCVNVLSVSAEHPTEARKLTTNNVRDVLAEVRRIPFHPGRYARLALKVATKGTQVASMTRTPDDRLIWRKPPGTTNEGDQ